jgi:lipopolysaccharide export system permease protein
MLHLTLARYLSLKFVATLSAAFLIFFCLIYLIDVVEMLRRTSGASDVTTLLVAWLCLLRTPAVTEQLLPFAILAGAMVSLTTLSRRLELIIARAAGVSVWQFLAPATTIAFLIGLVSVGAYNPLSAAMKESADRIETSIFKAGRQQTETVLWLRQRSVDGQSILRAEHASEGGALLSIVTAFVYDKSGAFEERVEGQTARLWPGFWEIRDARIYSPEDETQVVGSYLLATNLVRDQVTQTLQAPEAVSFWELPNLIDRATEAGLDAGRYRLRHQTLLARPLLFVAMVLIAACFSLRFFRFGGVARTLAGGVGAGFVLYVASKLVGDLGAAGLLSAAFAAWAPAIVGSLLGILVLLHQEDG